MAKTTLHYALKPDTFSGFSIMGVTSYSRGKAYGHVMRTARGGALTPSHNTNCRQDELHGKFATPGEAAAVLEDIKALNDNMREKRAALHRELRAVDREYRDNVRKLCER